MLKKILLSVCVAVTLGSLSVGAQEFEERRENAPASKSAVVIVNNVPVFRRYYLSKNIVKGDGALTACANGYHMASVAETHEPDTLAYQTTLGLAEDDSGQGPPSGHDGWIRSGSALNPFQNCAIWTSNDPADGGYRATWAFDHWTYATASCSASTSVWCIQDLK